MLSALRDGWTPPTQVTREEFAALRYAASSPLRAFAGFGCSFGGGWFKGYGVANSAHGSPALAASRSLARKLTIGKGWRNVEFLCRPYVDTPLIPGAVIYCDPPYERTSRPGLRHRFDSGAFWDWASAAHEAGCEVMVSESSAPAGWACVAEFARQQGLRTRDGQQFREALFTRERRA
jgi:DNA adenine methylase